MSTTTTCRLVRRLLPGRRTAGPMRRTFRGRLRASNAMALIVTGLSNVTRSAGLLNPRRTLKGPPCAFSTCFVSIHSNPFVSKPALVHQPWYLSGLFHEMIVWACCDLSGKASSTISHPPMGFKLGSRRQSMFIEALIWYRERDRYVDVFCVLLEKN